MMFIPALLLTLVAGFINGSFATPTKYMEKWKEESIWLIFSFWAFLLFPWLTLFMLEPQGAGVIAQIPAKMLLVILLGGLGFGLGQIFFALAFKFIGIGLNFVINISMGTAGSALVPLLWNRKLIGTEYSYLQFAGIFIFVVAVSVGAAAGAARDKKKKQEEAASKEVERTHTKTSALILGVLFSILAGLGSVCQGVSYIYVNPTVSRIVLDHMPSDLFASILTWILIFSVAWVPYVLYFLFLNLRSGGLTVVRKSGKIGEYGFMFVIMGLGFWASVVIFSRASQMIGGAMAPTIAWPLFMVFIILTSNLWGWMSGEWKNAGSSAIRRLWVSILLFICAIIVFSISSAVNPAA